MPDRAQGVAEIIMRLHVPWIVPQGLTMVCDRLLKFAVLGEDNSQIRLQCPRMWIFGEYSAAIGLHRFINSSPPPRLDHQHRQCDTQHGIEGKPRPIELI